MIKVIPHSVVDIITNSSSEMFTCTYGHNEKTVREILDALMDEWHVSDSPYYHDFGPPSVDTEVFSEEDAKWYNNIEAGKEYVTIVFDRSILPYDFEELLRSIFEVQNDS